MGTVACSRCGHLRIARAEACPACGAAPAEILPEGPSILARARTRRPRIVDVQGRIVPEPYKRGWASLRRKRLVELGVGAALIVVVGVVIINTIDPALLGLGSGTRTEVVLPAGTTENLTGGNPLAWHEFQTEQSGTLEGAFTISGGLGTVYVCYASQYSRFNGSGPISHIWASGLVNGGTLTTELSANEIYFVGGWPKAGNGTAVWPPTPLILTWTSPLEFLY